MDAFSQMRASDADRDRVLDVLGAAAAEGQLTLAELDRRLGATLSARTMGELAALSADLLAPPDRPEEAARTEDVLQLNQRGGSVVRGGGWVVPQRLVLRPSWCDVMLDFHDAVITEPTLLIEMNMRGGSLILVTGPGIVVEAEALAVRYTDVSIGAGARRDTPVLLHIEMSGRMRYGWLEIRYPPLSATVLGDRSTRRTRGLAAPTIAAQRTGCANHTRRAGAPSSRRAASVIGSPRGSPRWSRTAW